MDNRLKDGNYLITLKEGEDPIINNEGGITFHNNKEYKMIIKNNICLIESNENPNEYRHFAPTPTSYDVGLLEYFDVKEVC